MTGLTRLVRVVLAVVGLAAGGGRAAADLIVDPAGDFAPTYRGARNGAFDVVLAGGTFDGSTFHLTATLAGPVGGAPAGSTPLYVWGINTGTGVNNFANVGNPNVRFNRVFTLSAAGVSTAGTTGSVNGADIRLDVPLALVASTGFAPRDYLWNLWPRDTSAPADPAPIGSATAISDFAPDNAVAGFSPVPGPASLVLFACGAGVVGSFTRRRPRFAA